MIARILACGSLLLLLTGCGGRPGLPDGPVGSVTGKATYNGSPIPEGSGITFHPQDANLLSASGTVGSDGSYALYTKQQQQVMSGNYKVSISPPVEEVDEETAMKQMHGSGGATKPPPFPEKYFNEGTSGFEFFVKEGDQTIDLELKD